MSAVISPTKPMGQAPCSDRSNLTVTNLERKLILRLRALVKPSLVTIEVREGKPRALYVVETKREDLSGDSHMP